MNNVPSPERYLELFDELDLERIEDRRTGVHLLRNYFSIILTETATEKLGSVPSFGEDYLNQQWREVVNKFESIPGRLSEEVEGLPYQLAQARNSVTHIDRYDPREDIKDLEDIRYRAPEWRIEVEGLAEAYFHEWEDLSPKDALVDLAEQNLPQALATDPGFAKFEQDYEHLHSAAEYAMETLEGEADSDLERIEPELVECVKISQKLVGTVDDLEQDEGMYADYLANDVKDQMMGK